MEKTKSQSVIFYEPDSDLIDRELETLKKMKTGQKAKLYAASLKEIQSLDLTINGKPIGAAPKTEKDETAKEVSRRIKKMALKQLTCQIKATPVFVPSQFLKALLHHILVGILGPFTPIFLICFESVTYMIGFNGRPNVKVFSFVKATLQVFSDILCQFIEEDPE